MVLGLFEDTANKINLVLTDSTRFSDFDKAELFIGYLASFSRKESSSIETISEEKDDNEGGVSNE